MKTNNLKSDYTFSSLDVPTLNIGFHDPVHTCIKPQNAYNITFETLYNQINAKALEYNYMSNNKIKFWIQEKNQGGEIHFLYNCDKHFVSSKYWISIAREIMHRTVWIKCGRLRDIYH